MRRATGITLVLLGGGLAAGLSTCGPDAECREARTAGRPEAEQLCRSSSGGSHSSSSSSRSRWSWSGGDSSHSSSSRGGFGGTAHASTGGG